MYALTGASGRLGRLVLDTLVARVGAGRVLALARDPSRLDDVARRGVQVRAFDYDQPDALGPALAGVERLLLISGSEVGRREQQHQAVVDAAKTAGVDFIAYTSVLHADTNPIGLAAEHRAAEAAIRASGLRHAFLRHGWYTENFTMGAAAEVARGEVLGSSGLGRLSTATRADFAAADAAVLADPPPDNAVFELAGDEASTMADYAAALAETSGRPVRYVDMPEADYRAALAKAGLPPSMAALLSESSAHCASGVMYDDGHALSRLIGRPTTPMRQTVTEALNV